MLEITQVSWQQPRKSATATAEHTHTWKNNKKCLYILQSYHLSEQFSWLTFTYCLKLNIYCTSWYTDKVLSLLLGLPSSNPRLWLGNLIEVFVSLSPLTNAGNSCYMSFCCLWFCISMVSFQYDERHQHPTHGQILKPTTWVEFSPGLSWNVKQMTNLT